MTAVGPTALAGRLSGGIVTAARSSLADWAYTMPDVRKPAVREAAALLYRVRRADGLTPGKVAGGIAALAAELAEHRPLMLAALFCPADIPALLPEIAGRPPGDPVNEWLAACWIAEAAWSALGGPLAGPGYVAGDRDLLIPLAARLRFVALTEPMRYRGDPRSPLAASGPDEDPPAERAFGNQSWNLLVDRSREARRTWLACLDAYQSHPYLSQVRPRDLEYELRLVAFRGPSRRPLGLSVQPPNADVPLTPEDGAVIDEVTDRHFLPRFDLRSVAALARYGDGARERRERRVLAGAATAAGLAAIACAAALLADLATMLAFAFYALVTIGVARFGTRWAAPWLLRLPAAAAVGIIALVSFLPGAWLRAPYAAWPAAAALAAAACGYLVVEARNHGVGGWALLRSLAVAGVGAVHALLVSLIGLVAVAPAFVPQGAALAGIWRHPGYRHAGLVLLLSTAWCLAVGVFSQILWDDRPITAPLAHLSWRSRR